MKFVIASDLHGAAPAVRTLSQRIDEEAPDRVLLLGDLLYHGPRNDLPEGYAPKEVLAILNDMAERVIAVRGNCDAEVDQMVLQFPIMADYALFDLDGRTAFITHGHLFNLDNLPPHKPGDLLIHGHTHVLTVQEKDGMTYINPGSAALPKENHPKSYMIYENGVFTIKTLTGDVILTHKL